MMEIDGGSDECVNKYASLTMEAFITLITTARAD